jgi:hypothetical protein
MAAYAGQDEYILREVSRRPELLKGGGTRNLLLSAAIGGHKGLVSALVAAGSSPMDAVRLGGSNMLDFNYLPRDMAERADELPSVPVWLALAWYAAGHYFMDSSAFNLGQSLETLELLLEGVPSVEMRNCIFVIITRTGTGYSHFFTLDGFIRAVKPENEERLLSLIHKRPWGLGSVEAAQRLVSQWTPFFKQPAAIQPAPPPPPAVPEYIFSPERDREEMRRVYVALHRDPEPLFFEVQLY